MRIGSCEQHWPCVAAAFLIMHDIMHASYDHSGFVYTDIQIYLLVKPFSWGACLAYAPQIYGCIDIAVVPLQFGLWVLSTCKSQHATSGFWWDIAQALYGHGQEMGMATLGTTKIDVTLGRARPIGHSPANMAAIHFNDDRNSATTDNPLVPTAQEAKTQATRIYETLDAKGYGIVKRQHAADALADSKVRNLAAVDQASVINTSNLFDCSISLRVQTCSRSSKRCTWTQREQSAKHYS